ncbi:TauD/TfdA family dioxygenase [Zooshikella sp. RANM57]|uniref:TauD/TfdA family dioxygenase n=1 Tax=Zooshikella sp. RANM57 TaxID=3425863 RepID=UPI003D6E33B1
MYSSSTDHLEGQQEEFLKKNSRYQVQAYGDGYMALHTDSAYAKHYPRIMSLTCKVPATVGGSSIVMKSDTLSACLQQQFGSLVTQLADPRALTYI